MQVRVMRFNIKNVWILSTILLELYSKNFGKCLLEPDEVPTPNVAQLVAEREKIARQGYLLAAEGYRLAHVGESLGAGVDGHMTLTPTYQDAKHEKNVL